MFEKKLKSYEQDLIKKKKYEPSENVLSDMYPVKILIRLRESAVWSESSLGVIWIVKDAKFFMRTTKTQNGRKRRLICLCWGHVSESTLPDVPALISI